MVSLDDAVIARFEKFGKRFEIFVDSELVELWKEDNTSVEIEKIVAIEEVFHDAKDGERPTTDVLERVFETLNFNSIAEKILSEGSIQLTAVQRKKMVEVKRRQILQHVKSNAIDPKSKGPHPITRIELALEESRFSVDPFKKLELQIDEAIKLLKPLIPLSFENARLAFRINGKHYGAVSQILRQYKEKEEWMPNGQWVCIIEIPAGMKGELISKVMNKDSDAEYKEL
ncbi:MAG: ribosome assembly factor SBDS [Candidatus Thermoplasmatota archaeon]|nr:ribosome assembly factor SBDS [Candidatus Thermoplasmatota archaeon]